MTVTASKDAPHRPYPSWAPDEWGATQTTALRVALRMKIVRWAALLGVWPSTTIRWEMGQCIPRTAAVQALRLIVADLTPDEVKRFRALLGKGGGAS